MKSSSKGIRYDHLLYLLLGMLLVYWGIVIKPDWTGERGP
jgi:hypothetical protein